jgi:hypothetical protein
LVFGKVQGHSIAWYWSLRWRATFGTDFVPARFAREPGVKSPETTAIQCRNEAKVMDSLESVHRHGPRVHKVDRSRRKLSQFAADFLNQQPPCHAGSRYAAAQQAKVTQSRHD